MSVDNDSAGAVADTLDTEVWPSVYLVSWNSASACGNRPCRGGQVMQ